MVVRNFSRPSKGTSLRQNTHFEPSIMRIGFPDWAVREPEKVYKNKNNKRIKRTLTIYFTYACGQEPCMWQNGLWHFSIYMPFRYMVYEQQWVKKVDLSSKFTRLLQHCLLLPRWQVILVFLQSTFLGWSTARMWRPISIVVGSKRVVWREEVPLEVWLNFEWNLGCGGLKSVTFFPVMHPFEKNGINAKTVTGSPNGTKSKVGSILQDPLILKVPDAS
jgi:hypothetical protein